MANDLHKPAAGMDGQGSAAPATTPAREARAPRAVAGVIFASTFGVLLVAAYLDPSGSGTGTHQQLGLPPCGLLTTTGFPCATCGMTTSFSHAAEGNLVASFVNQPAGALFALLTAMAAIVSGYALVTGMALAPIGQALWRPRTVVALVVVLLLGWIYTLTRTFLGM